ncbi:MAG: hypothetical protein PHW60_01165 [Kiritimatiellae bacterium]|nr:hypothetical protein [Kiritimatiellia bacterium]
MIRLVTIGLLPLILSFAGFVFAAKLGRVGIYAHLCILCLIPVWLVVMLVDVASALKAGLGNVRFLLVRLSICLASFLILLLALRLGNIYRGHLFQERLPVYTEVISRAGQSLTTNEERWIKLDIPQGHENIAMVAAGRNIKGILMVKFLVSGHFPVRHFGYIYMSDDINGPVAVGAGTAITKLPFKGWYEFRD